MAKMKKMWRFTEFQKREIVNLWKGGLSTIAISRLYHCHDESIRQIIKKRVEETEYYRTCKDHMKRFNEVREIHPIKNPRFDKKLAWWVGVVKGDGYVEEKNYRVKLEVKDKDFRDRWANIGFRLFGIHPRLRETRREEGTYYIATLNSKLLVLYLKNKFGSFGKYNWNVPETIKKAGARIRLGFLGGLFDAEGSFKDNLSVTIVSVNKRAIWEIRKMLKESGIESSFKIETRRNRKNNYAIVTITHFKNLHSFAKKINFTIERKVRKFRNYLNKMDLEGYNVPAYMSRGT